MMQTWLERLIRFQQNYHKLMQGRYAKFDQLNRGLLIAALVFSLLSRWLPYRIGQLLFIVFFGVEPLIDMARTAVNVSGSMVAGIVTSARIKDLDRDVINDDKSKWIEKVILFLSARIVIKSSVHLKEKDEYV
ncbi:hypothetical protein EfmJHP35_16910 [Enterococcus faecium]|nr:hypothetical protein EfmJHP35_16910 [Enterococcus faecium]